MIIGNFTVYVFDITADEAHGKYRVFAVGTNPTSSAVMIDVGSGAVAQFAPFEDGQPAHVVEVISRAVEVLNTAHASTLTPEKPFTAKSNASEVEVIPDKSDPYWSTAMIKVRNDLGREVTMLEIDVKLGAIIASYRRDHALDTRYIANPQPR